LLYGSETWVLRRYNFELQREFDRPYVINIKDTRSEDPKAYNRRPRKT
jgi:hypothetical protein